MNENNQWGIFCNGLRNNGDVKRTFEELQQNPTYMIKAITLKNKDSFVTESFALPVPAYNIVRSKTTAFIRALQGFVPKNIMDALHAGAVEEAIKLLDPTNLVSENNIVEKVTQKYTIDLNNARIRLEAAQNTVHPTESIRQQEIDKYSKKIKEIERKINGITERIKNSEHCSICYGDFVNKSVAECCQGAYCFPCICLWLDKNPNCPLCRTKITSHNLKTIGEVSADQEDSIEVIEENIDEFSENKTKIENLSVLLRKMKTDQKFLIFSSRVESFQEISELLETMHIEFKEVKGHIKTTLQQYKEGALQVLLLHSDYCASGLNLENTTDLVLFHKFDEMTQEQIIGRAQRPGRKTSLNVWAFQHTIED
jgi:predicted translin family RNA/ssDNA-binding protein